MMNCYGSYNLMNPYSRPFNSPPPWECYDLPSWVAPPRQYNLPYSNPPPINHNLPYYANPPPMNRNFAAPMMVNINNNQITNSVNDSRVAIDLEDGELDFDDTMHVNELTETPEKRIDAVKKQLERVHVVKKQLQMCLKFRLPIDDLCPRLMNLGFRLTRLIPEVDDGEKEALLILFFDAVEKAKSVYLSVRKKTVQAKDRDALHRLLTHATAFRPLFGSLQLRKKEEVVITSPTTNNDNTTTTTTVNVDSFVSGAVEDVSSYQQSFGRSWMYAGHGDLPSPTPRVNVDPYGSGNVRDVLSYRKSYGRSWMYDANGDLPSPTPMDVGENGCVLNLTPAQEAALEPISKLLRQASQEGTLERMIKLLIQMVKGDLPGPTPSQECTDLEHVIKLPKQAVNSDLPGPTPSQEVTLEHVIKFLKQVNGDLPGPTPSQEVTLKRKTVPELVLDGPELKRQRNESTSDESGKVCSGVCDPRGDLRKAIVGSEAVANRPKVNTSIGPGKSSKLGISSTTEPQDIISANELFTNNNSRNTTGNLKPDNLEKKTSFACEEVKGGPVPPPKADDAWSDVEHFLDRFSEQQKAEIRKERARRLEEQKKLFGERKLSLVLDLDHTLLNSVRFEEVDKKHHDLLRKKEEQERGKPERHLFQLPRMAMWTKLRPGIWKFLEKASKLFELHIYTMGNRCYATEMAKLLDPKGELFAGRIMSRGDDGDQPLDDDNVRKTKDMEGVLGMDSSVVIIDDTVDVWPHNNLNLIRVERYIYFPSSRRQLKLSGPSLLEIDRDESQEDGTLASVFSLTERIHENFFAHDSLDVADVRDILASEQRKILAGCRILFSRIIPIGANPDENPLWQTAERFGAVCTNQIDDQVTHVVASSLGTEKVNWAFSNGRFVVHPSWVDASAFLYKRANEKDFVIKQQK